MLEPGEFTLAIGASSRDLRLITALTAFPGMGLDQGTVDELLRRLRDRRA